MSDEIPLMMEREAGAPDFVAQIAVGFGLMPVEDKGESAKQGRRVFIDREFFSAKVPGDKNTHSLRLATQQDRDRFPRAYAAFQQRGLVPLQGTPLEEWPQVTRGQAMTLKAAGVHTVEAMAEVHDGHIDKLGANARELKVKAKSYVALAKDTAEAQRLADENRKKDEEMAELRRQIADLASRLDVPEKRGPGRPRKDAEAA